MIGPPVLWAVLYFIQPKIDEGAFELMNIFLIFADQFVNRHNFTLKMARVCQITGKRPLVGNNVSHANNRTKRKFYPNLHKKRFFIPEEDRWITLKVSASAIRTINRNGITAVLKKAKKQGNILV